MSRFGVPLDVLRASLAPAIVHKHLWKLPIPEFDPEQGLHVDIAEAGATAAAGARAQLAQLREERGDKLTVTIVRRELRAVAVPRHRREEPWRTAVGKLLAGG